MTCLGVVTSPWVVLFLPLEPRPFCRGLIPELCVAQAIGAEGVVAAQCRSLVKAYLPQLVKIIATMPADQVGSLTLASLLIVVEFHIILHICTSSVIVFGWRFWRMSINHFCLMFVMEHDACTVCEGSGMLYV